MIDTDNHKYHKPCEDPRCVICEGGLYYCERCGCGEASLLAECPGGLVSIDDQDAILKGRVVSLSDRRRFVITGIFQPDCQCVILPLKEKTMSDFCPYEGHDSECRCHAQEMEAVKLLFMDALTEILKRDVHEPCGNGSCAECFMHAVAANALTHPCDVCGRPLSLHAPQHHDHPFKPMNH